MNSVEKVLNKYGLEWKNNRYQKLSEAVNEKFWKQKKKAEKKRDTQELVQIKNKIMSELFFLEIRLKIKNKDVFMSLYKNKEYWMCLSLELYEEIIFELNDKQMEFTPIPTKKKMSFRQCFPTNNEVVKVINKESGYELVKDPAMFEKDKYELTSTVQEWLLGLYFDDLVRESKKISLYQLLANDLYEAIEEEYKENIKRKTAGQVRKYLEKEIKWLKEIARV